MDFGSDMEGLLEGSQLLLAQFDLVLEFALVYDQFGFHSDKVRVVVELVLTQVLGQQVGHLSASSIDVLLKPFGLL